MHTHTHSSLSFARKDHFSAPVQQCLYVYFLKLLAHLDLCIPLLLSSLLSGLLSSLFGCYVSSLFSRSIHMNNKWNWIIRGQSVHSQCFHRKKSCSELLQFSFILTRVWLHEQTWFYLTTSFWLICLNTLFFCKICQDSLLSHVWLSEYSLKKVCQFDRMEAWAHAAALIGHCFYFQETPNIHERDWISPWFWQMHFTWLQSFVRHVCSLGNPVL